MNLLYDISAVEIGQHFYWTLGGFQMHGQVLINSWIVLGLVIAFALVTTSDLKPVPEGGQNLAEFVVEYIRDIAKTQIGEGLVKKTAKIRDKAVKACSPPDNKVID